MIEDVINELREINSGNSLKNNHLAMSIIARFLFKSSNENGADLIPILESYKIQEAMQIGFSEELAKETVYWNLRASALLVDKVDFYLNSTSLNDYSHSRKKQIYLLQ